MVQVKKAERSLQLEQERADPARLAMLLQQETALQAQWEECRSTVENAEADFGASFVYECAKALAGIGFVASTAEQLHPGRVYICCEVSSHFGATWRSICKIYVATDAPLGEAPRPEVTSSVYDTVKLVFNSRKADRNNCQYLEFAYCDYAVDDTTE